MEDTQNQAGAAAAATVVDAPESQPQPAAPETPAAAPLFEPAAKSVFDLFGDGARRSAEPQPPAKAEALPEAQAEEKPAEASPDTPPAEPQTLEQIIAELRAQHPETPEVVLKRLADKEKYIQDLKAKQGEQSKQITELLARVTKKEEAQQSHQPAQTMTELERQALGVEKPAAAVPAATPPNVPAAQVPAQPAPAAAGPEQAAVTLPEYLRSPEAAYSELSLAMAQGDFSKAHQIEEEIFGLRMAAMAPKIQDLIRSEANRLIQESVGDVIPVVRESVAAQQAEQDREVAIAELEKSGETSIRKLFDPLSDGSVEVGGQRFLDNEANRIIAENPWINTIQVQHQDPRVAYRLTLINRYRAINQVARLKQAGAGQVPAQSQAAQSQAAPAAAAAPAATPIPVASGIPPEQAQALVQAGREQAQREEADRIRAAMNGGRVPPAADGKDDVGRLTARSGSWADMFR